LINLSIKKMVQNSIRFIIPRKQNSAAIRYWEERVKMFGQRSVLNIGHRDDEIEAITNMQRKEIYPHFRKSLMGNEKLVLDFGCGPGRFTIDLADMINGKALGVDPIATLLEMAPKHANVQYTIMKEGEIPFPANYVDIVWICLVLGGIRKPALTKTINEIQRVLKADGLLFLVENTSDMRSTKNWAFRQCSDYKNMFPFVNLRHLHDYFDFDERISIMAGRQF